MTKSEHSSSSASTRSGIFATLERDDFLASDETPPTKKVKLENLTDSSHAAINRPSRNLATPRNGLVADKKTFWGSIDDDHPNDEAVNVANLVQNIKMEVPERESSVTEESASNDIEKGNNCPKQMVSEKISERQSSSFTSSVATDDSQSSINGAITDNQNNGALNENVDNESSVSSSLFSKEGFVVSALELPQTAVDNSEVSACSSEVGQNTQFPETTEVVPNPEVEPTSIVEEESAVSADSEDNAAEVTSDKVQEKGPEPSDMIVEPAKSVEPCSQTSEAIAAKESCANNESNPIVSSAETHIDSSEDSESSFATTVSNLVESTHVHFTDKKRREHEAERLKAEEAARLKEIAVESLPSTVQLVADLAQTNYENEKRQREDAASLKAEEAARLKTVAVESLSSTALLVADLAQVNYENEKRQQQEDAARLKAENAARLKDSLTSTAHIVANSGQHILSHVEVSTVNRSTPVCATSATASAFGQAPVSSSGTLINLSSVAYTDPDSEVEQRRRTELESTVTNVARNFESLRTYEKYYSRLRKPIPEACEPIIFPPMTEEEDDVLRAPPDDLSFPRTSITSEISEEAQRELTDPAVDMSASNPFALWAPEEPVESFPMVSQHSDVDGRDDGVIFSASVPVSSVQNNSITFTGYLPHVMNSSSNFQPSSSVSTTAISDQNQSAVQSVSLGFNVSNASISRLTGTQHTLNTSCAPLLSSGTVVPSSTSISLFVSSSNTLSALQAQTTTSFSLEQTQLPVSTPTTSSNSHQSVVRIKDEPLDTESVAQLEKRPQVVASQDESLAQECAQGSSNATSETSVAEMAASANDADNNQPVVNQSQYTENAQPLDQTSSSGNEPSNEEEHGDVIEQSMAEMSVDRVKFVMRQYRETWLSKGYETSQLMRKDIQNLQSTRSASDSLLSQFLSSEGNLIAAFNQFQARSNNPLPNIGANVVSQSGNNSSPFVAPSAKAVQQPSDYNSLNAASQINNPQFVSKASEINGNGKINGANVAASQQNCAPMEFNQNRQSDPAQIAAAQPTSIQSNFTFANPTGLYNQQNIHGQNEIAVNGQSNLAPGQNGQKRRGRPPNSGRTTSSPAPQPMIMPKFALGVAPKGALNRGSTQSQVSNNANSFQRGQNLVPQKYSLVPVTCTSQANSNSNQNVNQNTVVPRLIPVDNRVANSVRPNQLQNQFANQQTMLTPNIPMESNVPQSSYLQNGASNSGYNQTQNHTGQMFLDPVQKQQAVLFSQNGMQIGRQEPAGSGAELIDLASDDDDTSAMIGASAIASHFAPSQHVVQGYQQFTARNQINPDANSSAYAGRSIRSQQQRQLRPPNRPGQHSTRVAAPVRNPRMELSRPQNHSSTATSGSSRVPRSNSSSDLPPAPVTQGREKISKNPASLKYSLPPRLELKAEKTGDKNMKGATLTWSYYLNYQKSQNCKVEKYELLAYNSSNGNRTWLLVETINALVLPMQCMLTNLTPGKVSFVIRGVDSFQRKGDFSNVVSIDIS